MSTRVAVIGATGFIGRHVLAELLQKDVSIVATSRTAGKLDVSGETIRVTELDLANPGAMLFERLERPQIVIHLAWEGLPNYQSLVHFERELPRQYQFLKDLVIGGASKLLIAGTCFEYGLRAGALCEAIPTRPVTPYGFAKECLRRELEFLQLTVPFALTWARLFYLFGDGQGERSLWSQLHAALKRGDLRFPMSAGEQLRDFLPVATAAQYLVQLALSGRDLGIVNVCSGEPRSIRAIVEQWVQRCDKEIELDLGRYPYPDYEPMAFWGDRRKLDSIVSSNADR